VPSQSALTDALGVIEAKAQSASREPLWLRVGEHGAGVVIDLGTADGAAVEADAEGWRILDRSPIVFRRTELTMPLPIPERGGDLEQLRAVLNVNDDSWPLLLGWLISVFFPEIPHSILLFAGEQGCGKSTAARLATMVADPSAAPLQAPPANVENWITTAQGSHVVTLDNLSGVPVWLSDALCRAVTGESLAKRTLYTDGDLHVTKFRRCVVLTTIAPGALRGDLAERLVTVDLDRIDPRHRRPENELRSRFDDMHPSLLGAALDLLAQVLEALPGIDLEQHPRMADMARVYAAVDHITGSNSLPTYLANGDKIAQAVVSDDLVASAVVDLIAARDTWHGTPTQLLDQLTQQQFPDGKRPPKGWPQTASGLSRQIRLATTALRQVGVDVEIDRGAPPTRKRTIRLTKNEPEPGWTAWTATENPAETPSTPKTPPDLGVSEPLDGVDGMDGKNPTLSLLAAFPGSTLETT
jgi:DNA polymerase III delta prime subunit